MTLAQVHNLSGPIAVSDTKGEPAHPGDLLVVEILNLGPLEGDEWGFTGTFDRENGGMACHCPPLILCSNTAGKSDTLTCYAADMRMTCLYFSYSQGAS